METSNAEIGNHKQKSEPRSAAVGPRDRVFAQLRTLRIVGPRIGSDPMPNLKLVNWPTELGSKIPKLTCLRLHVETITIPPVTSIPVLRHAFLKGNLRMNCSRVTCGVNAGLCEAKSDTPKASKSMAAKKS